MLPVPIVPDNKDDLCHSPVPDEPLADRVKVRQRCDLLRSRSIYELVVYMDLAI